MTFAPELTATATFHGRPLLTTALAVALRNLGVTPSRAHQASSAAIITQVRPAIAVRLLGIAPTTASNWHNLATASIQHR